MRERTIQIIGILCIAAGLTIWLTSTFKENILFFLTPSELAVLPETHQTKTGKRFRIGGLVAIRSIVKNETDILFTIIDKNQGKLNVHYKGLTPELFKENQGIIAEGVLNKGIFEAERLLAKHDERYMPKEIAEKLKAEKLWRETQTTKKG